MDTNSSNPNDHDLDVATSARLARLRTMQVNTSGLEGRLLAQIPRPAPELKLRLVWVRPLRAIAAGLLVFGLLAALLISTSGGPALASPAQMAQLHYDLVSGKTPVMQVDSVDAANKMLSGQWPQSPQIPKLPAGDEMACCMKSIKDKKVACVVLRKVKMGVPVTMTVANAADMKLPMSPTINRNGVTYHVQSSGQLNMLMTQRNGRWICLIGQTSNEGLMDLADQLQF
jgi:hypothetical protein